MAVVVAIAIVVAIGPASSTSALSLGIFGVVVGASIVGGAASLVSPASLCRMAGSIFTVSVLIVVAAPVITLIAVPAATRFFAFVALAATFLVFLMLLAIAFLFLVEASGHLFEPAVGNLVCAVHDTAQDELLHLGLLVSDRRCPQDGE